MTFNTKSTPSYSKVVKNNFGFPRKNQAIIFDFIKNVEIEDYLNAIKKFTDLKNIFAASRITQNKLCFYLKSATLVDELTEEVNYMLIIDGVGVIMRPNVTKLKRVIFSNVHSCNPHDILLNKLSEF